MRGARRRGRADGFSLVEVLMAMLVMSLLGLAVVGTVSSVARSSTAANDRLQATNRAQIIVDRLTRTLRSAHPMTPPSAAGTTLTAFDTVKGITWDDVTFYADLGDKNGPTKVRFFLSGLPAPHATLTEQDTTADAGGSGSNYTYASVPTTLRMLGPADMDGYGALFGGSTTEFESPFTFYGAAGNQILVGSGLKDPALTGPITRVDIKVNVKENNVAVTSQVRASVYLRNVEYK